MAFPYPNTKINLLQHDYHKAYDQYILGMMFMRKHLQSMLMRCITL